MALTKVDISENIQSELNLTKHKSIELIETLLEIIKKSLVSGNDVMISNFGKLHVQSKKERRGRNPATGTAMMLDARRVVTFKSSQTLKDKVNGNR